MILNKDYIKLIWMELYLIILKKTIMKWNPNDPRPNKPATIRAKMRKSADVKGKNQVKNDPYRVLHDTGVMVNSVVCKVDGVLKK